MLEEVDELKYSDPPRLNRCEKQILTYTDVLNDDQKRLLKDVANWAKLVSRVKDASYTFNESDMFTGFNPDTLSSLLVSLLHSKGYSNASAKEVLSECQQMLLDVVPADAIVRMRDSLFGAQDADRQQEMTDLADTYFSTQYHAGLAPCLRHFWAHLDIMDTSTQNRPDTESQDPRHAGAGTAHSLVVMTFTAMVSKEVLMQYLPDGSESWQEGGYKKSWQDTVHFANLGKFQSEHSLREELQTFWSDTGPLSSKTILLMQCDAVRHEPHLLLCRELMLELMSEYQRKSLPLRKEQAIILHMR